MIPGSRGKTNAFVTRIFCVFFSGGGKDTTQGLVPGAPRDNGFEELEKPRSVSIWALSLISSVVLRNTDMDDPLPENWVIVVSPLDGVGMIQ